MCSAGDDAALPAPGFPIRESAGHRLFSASPRLIAAVHALHRLLVPRHPPRALTILTVIEPKWFGDTRCWRSRVHAIAVATVQFSKIAGGVRSPTTAPGRGMREGARLAPVSQNSTACRASGVAPQDERYGRRRSVRFGRRARPDGRSSGPGWDAGSAGAPFGAP
jgi:hypothetical protein